jgi:ribosomal protein L37E
MLECSKCGNHTFDPSYLTCSVCDDGDKTRAQLEAENADLQKRLGEAEATIKILKEDNSKLHTYVHQEMARGNDLVDAVANANRKCLQLESAYNGIVHRLASGIAASPIATVICDKDLKQRAEAAEARADELARLLSAETKFHETARQDAKLWERRYLRACALSERVK